MKFEIINPSDETYIESDDYLLCCIATDLLSTNYGLREVDGDKEKPPFMFGHAEEWYQKTFNMSIEQAFESIDKLKLASILDSVKSKTHSSMNEIEKIAHQMAKKIREKENKQTDVSKDEN